MKTTEMWKRWIKYYYIVLVLPIALYLHYIREKLRILNNTDKWFTVYTIHPARPSVDWKIIFGKYSVSFARRSNWIPEVVWKARFHGDGNTAYYYTVCSYSSDQKIVWYKFRVKCTIISRKNYNMKIS